MATTLRPVGHEDRLSLVEHLDELRTRLIVCALTLAVAFGLCFWQQDRLLDVLNQPLEETTTSVGTGPLEQNARFQSRLRGALEQTRVAFDRLARGERLSPAERRDLTASARALRVAVQALPKEVPKRQPVTIGVTEPFTTTLTVSLAWALLFSLPIILYQLYAFVLPAFSKREREVAVPLMLAVPFLFVAGVLFAYFVVLPPAIRFLQNFNDSSFDILVQARDYYRFELLAMLALGILFQMPVGILAVTRLGIVTPRQLRKNRRYAIVVIAVLAMLLPGTDPITMLIAMAPLLVLYELSIMLAAWLDRRERKRGGGNDGDLVPETEVDS